ncbi:sporozoite surface protein 2-like [Sitodiplosis mosellana]|uniref:sporozoite surface protein 2-like n=1 Tax=Sitodiplosis mosellana TaxID=263140 RepID=UPI002444B2C7|nr:sporozoite surface protein 2-like [Sitodiplosis mosellana]
MSIKKPPIRQKGFETTPGNYPGSDENTPRGSTPLPNGQNPNGGSPNEPGYPGHPGKPSSQQPNSSNPSGQNPTNDQPDTDGYWTPGKYIPGQKPQSRIGKPSSGNPTSSNPNGQNPGAYTPGKSSSGSSHDDLLKSVPQIQTNGKPLDGQGIINNLKNCVDPNTNTIGAHDLFPYLNGQIDMPLSNLLSRPRQSFPVDYDGISESSSGNSDLLSSLSVSGLLGGSSSSSGSNGGSGLLSGLGGVLSGGSNDNKKSSGILGGLFG